LSFALALSATLFAQQTEDAAAAARKITEVLI